MFGWVVDDEGLIVEVFVAEIQGILPGAPGQLILGAALILGPVGPVGGGFTPTDEDLDLGDESDEGDVEGDLSA